MFESCSLMNPPDGAYCRGYNASRVRRRQYVTSIAARSWNPPISVPTSHSVLTSGFRSGSPRLLGVTPAPSSDASGAKVVSLSNAPGWRPDWPRAARSRNVVRREVSDELCHAGRRLGWIETLTFGYKTPCDVLPKALFRS